MAIRVVAGMASARTLCVAAFALCLAKCCLADTVWLDEPGVWDRMSGGHGRSWVCTNGQKMVMGKYRRGVGTCAPSALYLAMNGNALSFEATVGQLYGPNRSKLTFRVYRENELAFETPVLDRDSGPHRIKADLSGARWIKLEAYGVEAPYSGTSIWGDARFEMKPGTRPQDIAILSPQLGALTPPPSKSPRINGPALFGARPGNPVAYRVPVTGERPLAVTVEGLGAPGLEGLAFNAASQMITGRVAKAGTYPLVFRAANAHGRAERRFRLVIGEKIALTPPLGWNSWNAFANTVTAKLVMETADEMARLGLADHGWTYLTIDDGWQVSFKSGKRRRDPHGRPLSNELFPDMKGLADHVHALGFKIGLYSSPGPKTCAGYEGSWMHERIDAKTYAEWGYDYLKHDWCSYGEVAFGKGVERWMYPYLVMGRALRESGRDIVHSICEYGAENVAAWGAAAFGQCWRTTGDKFDFWEDVVTDMATHENLWRYAGPGAWNDADMMLIGSTHWSGHKGTRLTPNEQYTHVSMWAMWAAPMMIGCDLRGVDPFTLSLITNDEVIDLNQDELGAAAAKIQGGEDWSCWARPLSDGSIAAALVNLSPYPQEVLFCLKKAGMAGTWKVRDLWRQRDEGNATGGYRASVPGHATHLVRFTPGAGARLRDGLADVRDNDWFRRIEAFRSLQDGDCEDCPKGAASVSRAKISFEGAKQSHYNGRTRAISGAAAEGADFMVVCTSTSTCETAWGVFAQPVPVPKDAAHYSLEFEISADRDWINPDTSGESWDNAINWLDAGGRRIGRRRLSLEFRKGGFARFRFVGAVPSGAERAQVQFGVDGPNLPPGEKVTVKGAAFTFLPDGAEPPAELIPDLRAPLVRSRFKSPSTNPMLKVAYEISDYTAVDWASVAVTDAVAKAAIPFARSGDTITLAPGAPWAAGRHLVDVAVRDVLGNATVSRKVFLIGERARPAEVSLRSDGMALVGGKPFFPIGMYAVGRYAFNGDSLDEAVRGLVNAGLNTVHSYGDRYAPELFEAVAKHGARQWTSGHGAYRADDSWFMATGRTDRTVLAWYIGDDTSMNTTPGQLFDRDEAVKMLDDSRITCHADGVRAKAAKSNYQEYVNHADVFMPEIYPIDGFKDERCVAEVCRDMDRCWDDIRKYGDGTRPRGVWPILQCFHGKGWTRYPTVQEMYAMSFAAIIHGGNGITWFKYGGEIGEKGTRYSGMFRTREDWCAMTNITMRIAALAPYLTEVSPPQPQPPMIVDGPATDPLGQPAVTLLLKRRNGAMCLLAVNAANARVRARFRLEGTGDAKCRVEWEGRELTIARGEFEDDFEPFGVHVYRIEPK